MDTNKHRLDRLKEISRRASMVNAAIAELHREYQSMNGDGAALSAATFHIETFKETVEMAARRTERKISARLTERGEAL